MDSCFSCKIILTTEDMTLERERSPNYPAYSLEQTIGFARQVHSKIKRVSVGMEALAKALGSESLTGPSRSKIAALRHYGLMDFERNGRTLRISDRALALLLRKPGDREYDEAAREAALAPALFAELHGERAGMDDDALHYYLVAERRFSDDGARRAIRSLRETMQFAKLEPADYTTGSVADDAEEAPVNVPEADPMNARLTLPNLNPVSGSPLIVSAVPPLRMRLSPAVHAVVSFEGGEPSAQAIKKLINLLQVMYGDEEAADASDGGANASGLAGDG